MFETEVMDDADNFFQKKLVKSRLSKDQYERWNVETKDMIGLLREMVKESEEVELPPDAVPTTYSKRWGVTLAPSFFYFNDFESELEMKIMATTSYDLSDILSRIKFKERHVNESFLSNRGRWVII